jgi:hypothetical protein
MKKKNHTYEFDPQVYPLKLWVCSNATKEGLNDEFEFLQGNAGVAEALEENFATTSSVRRKSDGELGVLVYASKKSYLTGSVIAHESVHVADYYFQELRMLSQMFEAGNEPYAYLVGWAAKYINQARINK